MTPEGRVWLPDIVGGGYGQFWRWHGRYLVCKGSRGSKKSTTAALKIITEMMRLPGLNTLVVRRYAVTHQNSTFAQLRWAINRLGVSHLWQARVAPMTLTFKPTGQVILFKGMDDPQSIASITVPRGVIGLVWVEEAYQVSNEDDFNKLDLSIRGEAPAGVYKQFILTFNPWNDKHWLKKRFFDIASPDTLAMTTNYLCNEWLTTDDQDVFDRMRDHSPRRYRVEGLGDWGHSQGVIYDNWEIADFDWKKIYAQIYQSGKRVFTPLFGLDFGFTTDPTAFIALLADPVQHLIYIFDEVYGHSMTNQQIYDRLAQGHYTKVRIKADAAEPRTINELWMLGLKGIVPAKKGPDSIRAGIQRLQDYRIIVHPRCHNTEIELANYSWQQTPDGVLLPKPAADGFDHLMDALRYATEDLGEENFSW